MSPISSRAAAALADAASAATPSVLLLLYLLLLLLLLQYEEACTEALRLLRSRSMDIMWAVPPPPPTPEAAAAAAAAAAPAAATAATSPSSSPTTNSNSINSNSSSSSSNSGSNGVQTPTTLYMPDASVEPLPRRKATGAFRVYIHAASAAAAADSADAAAAFRCITKIWVYVHRPVRGGPPLLLQPAAANLSCVLQQEVLLAAAADDAAAAAGRSSSSEVYIDVAAVQPLALEKKQRYWIGVQVQSRRRHLSLINWLPLHLTVCVPPLPPLHQLQQQQQQQEEEVSLFSEDEGKQQTQKKRQTLHPQETLHTAAKAALALLHTFIGAPFLSSPLQQQLQQQLQRLQQHAAAAPDPQHTAATSSYRAAVIESRELLQQCMHQAEAWTDATTD